MKSLILNYPRSSIRVHVRFLKRHFSVNSAPPKTYTPNSFEQEYYKLWMEKGYFQPNRQQRIFSVLLPPPNVTGTLHLGHALTVTSLDVLARWRRMRGDEVVWVPGIDHAGIATQAVVEKVLKKQGILKSSLGREKFLEEVWKWKNSKGPTISSQLKALGASLDWSREYFTMDEAHSKAVVEALLLLWNKGLIYRDESLVNWSPHLRSTLSDIEIDYINLNGPTAVVLPGYEQPIQFGEIFDFAYKVVGTDDEIVVSTTRPETMLGDVAVAVNPNDERYRHLWGSVLLHPFTGAEIPLVLDYNVDPNFGTGALKVTPAHDRTDFLIGKSHNLPIVTVINEDGTMGKCGPFSGMKRFKARDAICDALAEKGLFRGKRPHKIRIPVCSRTGDVIELLIKPQWYIKCKGMAEKAISAVKDKKMIITPEKYCDNWFNWLENIQDWCISRQLWWGHPVPFYSCEGDGKQAWFPAKSEKEANEIAQASFSCPVTVTRDPDVLDTWFSSALLPFSSFGWPMNTEDLKRYYPLSTLVTGNDILFFWAARMAMLGLELTGQVPFKEIFLHGIICDSQGRKMSKSLGNVIDPEDVVKGKSLQELSDRIGNSLLSDEEIKRAKVDLKKHYPQGIPECGVDALRFTLFSHNIKNQFVNFDVKDCEVMKRFCNKIWQACNFTKIWLDKYKLGGEPSVELETLNTMDKWIIFRLKSMIETVNESLNARDLHVAANAIRTFIHNELCDIYLESIKPVLRREGTKEGVIALNVLRYSLESSIKCLAPFMPFLSEYLHAILTGSASCSLMEESFPTVNLKVSKSVQERVSYALNIVQAIRRMRHDIGINNQQKIEVWLSNNSSMEDLKETVETLAHCSLRLGSPQMQQMHWRKETLSQETDLFINLQDCKPQKTEDISSVVKRKEKIKKELDKLINMTSKQGYEQASPEIQKSHQEKIFKLKTEIQKIESLEEGNSGYQRHVSQ